MDVTHNSTDWLSFITSAQRRKPTITTSQSFSGTRSYSDAVSLALTGWIETAEKCKQFSAGLFDRLSTLIERHEIRYDVEGSGLDVSRYLEGEPEHWQNFETVLADAPSNAIVRLCVNCGASAGISTDVIISKGAAIAALVELLEFSGRRVELSIVFCAVGQTVTDSLTILVKAADQPLDLPRIAFILAHPSMLRRLMFAYWEAQPTFRHIGASFGRPGEYKPDAADIYIPRSAYPDVQWSNTQSAEAFILAELQKQGIALKREEK